MTEVDVVLVAYGPHSYLQGALESLASQTRPPRRTVVVDNDPEAPLPDGPWPVPVDLVRPGENLGFARGVRVGLERTRAPLVALLNPDARPHSGWLEALVDALSAHPDHAWAASLVLSASDPDRIESAGHTLGLWGRGVRLGQGQTLAGFLERHGERPFTVPGAPACASMYTRRYFDATGGFEGDFFLVYEDLDADLRAALAGLRCLLVPSARVVHDTSAIRGRGSDLSVYHEERNALWTLARTVPAPWLLPMAPLKALLVAYGALVKARRGQWRPYAAGLAAGLAGLRPCLAARRRILARSEGATRTMRSVIAAARTGHMQA